MASTPECATKGAPASGPKPVTMLTTPSGSPASSNNSTRLMVDSGVSSVGLITQVLPQTRAGKSFHEGIALGQFQGVIMPQTPTGIRTDMANLSGNSEGVVWPKSLRPSPAM